MKNGCVDLIWNTKDIDIRILITWINCWSVTLVRRKESCTPRIQLMWKLQVLKLFFIECPVRALWNEISVLLNTVVFVWRIPNVSKKIHNFNYDFSCTRRANHNLVVQFFKIRLPPPNCNMEYIYCEYLIMVYKFAKTNFDMYLMSKYLKFC